MCRANKYSDGTSRVEGGMGVAGHPTHAFFSRVVLVQIIETETKRERARMATKPKPKSLSLQAIRAESRNRDLEERLKQEKRRNTLVLIMRFLTDHRQDR